MQQSTIDNVQLEQQLNSNSKDDCTSVSPNNVNTLVGSSVSQPKFSSFYDPSANKLGYYYCHRYNSECTGIVNIRNPKSNFMNIAQWYFFKCLLFCLNRLGFYKRYEFRWSKISPIRSFRIFPKTNK